MTIGKKFFLCFGLALLVGLAVSILGLSSVRTLGKLQDELVVVDIKQLNLAHDIKLAAEQMRSAQRGFVLDSYARNSSGSDQNKAAFRKIAGAMEAKLAEVGSLLDTEQEKLIPELCTAPKGSDGVLRQGTIWKP